MKHNPKVQDYINQASEHQVELLEEVRQSVHDTVSNVSEEIKWGFPVFSNGKDFAYLRYAKAHVTLGFYNIDKLHDPNNLLEGEGNTLRHVKLKALDQEMRQQIVVWLKEITD